ncbi:hypothetical protein XELAEV_18021367mg [Xenopus laevis]|uniref:Uncharacterized protein n=1 Tax=Xenopus laevis TaxID=8355 RepID=A0A974DAA0_XENLA|nr:hypothetical protein XELAEV_18021367mg [Xenopus laevis]
MYIFIHRHTNMRLLLYKISQYFIDCKKKVFAEHTKSCFQRVSSFCAVWPCLFSTPLYSSWLEHHAKPNPSNNTSQILVLTVRSLLNQPISKKYRICIHIFMLMLYSVARVDQNTRLHMYECWL